MLKHIYTDVNFKNTKNMLSEDYRGSFTCTYHSDIVPILLCKSLFNIKDYVKEKVSVVSHGTSWLIKSKNIINSFEELESVKRKRNVRYCIFQGELEKELVYITVDFNFNEVIIDGDDLETINILKNKIENRGYRNTQIRGIIR